MKTHLCTEGIQAKNPLSKTPANGGKCALLSAYDNGAFTVGVCVFMPSVFLVERPFSYPKPNLFSRRKSVALLKFVRQSPSLSAYQRVGDFGTLPGCLKNFRGNSQFDAPRDFWNFWRRKRNAWNAQKVGSPTEYLRKN